MKRIILNKKQLCELDFRTDKEYTPDQIGNVLNQAKKIGNDKETNITVGDDNNSLNLPPDVSLEVDPNNQKEASKAMEFLNGNKAPVTYTATNENTIILSKRKLDEFLRR